MSDPTPPQTWIAVALAALSLASAGVKAVWAAFKRKDRLLREEQRDHRKTLKAYAALLRKYERMRDDDSLPPLT